MNVVFKNVDCNFCKKQGHIEKVCLSKKKQSNLISAQPIRTVNSIDSVDREPLLQTIFFNGKSFVFQVDTGTSDNFCDKDIWFHVGKPPLKEPEFKYIGANGKPLHVLGRFSFPVKTHPCGQLQEVEFAVAKKPLKLLGELLRVRWT